MIIVVVFASEGKLVNVKRLCCPESPNQVARIDLWFWFRSLGLIALFVASSIDAQAQSLTTLVSFPTNSEPTGPLVQAPDGNFYGTTSVGGANNAGTIFRVTRPVR